VLKLKFNTSSEQNTNCNFNMAHHMQRGDYYHIGVNRRHDMRGGSTQAERGEAAEMREMNPKTSTDTNSDMSRPSSQLHFLLNQIVHDKSTDPIEDSVPGLFGLLRSIRDSGTVTRFKREPTPTTAQLQERANDITRANGILAAGDLDRVIDPGLIAEPENAGMPLDQRYAAIQALRKPNGNPYYVPEQHTMVRTQLMNEASAYSIELPPGNFRGDNQSLFNYIESEKRARGL
jgi:hypothetical protein